MAKILDHPDKDERNVPLEVCVDLNSESIPGARITKAYPIASGELWGLFAFGALAAILFSVATNLFIFSFEIHKDLELNQPVSKEISEKWAQNEKTCFNWGIGLLVLCGISMGLGSLKIIQIKNETTFDQ